jgi:hypothetical protein
MPSRFRLSSASLATAGLAAALSVMAGGAAKADVTVFTNFSGSPPFNNNVDYVLGSPSAGIPPNVVDAMPFTAGATADLKDAALALNWFGSDTNSPVTLDLDSNAGGEPGAILATLTQTGTIPINPPGLVTFAYSGAPVALALGTQYWLVAAQPDVNTLDFWNFSNTDTGAIAGNLSGSATGPWMVFPGQQIAAFEVSGAAPIPEPGTFSLVGLGALGLWAKRRRAFQSARP